MFDRYLKEHGTNRRDAISYTLQQNDVAEGKIEPRWDNEMYDCVVRFTQHLQDYGKSQNFWRWNKTGLTSGLAQSLKIKKAIWSNPDTKLGLISS